MKIIGILGGTFDPVHCAHLRMVIEIQEHLALDQVVLWPAGSPRLRDPPAAPAAARLALLEAAAAEVHGIVVDGRELEREGPTRTVESLAALREEPGFGLDEASLVFIMGLDAFARFDAWHEPERILTLAHLLVVDRPGVALPDCGLPARLLASVKCEDVAELRLAPAGRVYVLRAPRLEISSTAIRERLAAGRNIQYLVPAKVRELIERQGLYQHAK